jgi:chemotaxis protein methyltransferase CheR
MQANAKAVHLLTKQVQSRFGIQPSRHVELKLERIFEHTAEQALCDWVAHLNDLPATDNEWLSLVESLTVHETYFGRDKPMLAMLLNEVMPMLLARKKRIGDCSFKIWSAGCSTGEETTNLLILLLQAMQSMNEATLSESGELVPLPGWRLEVLGTDVSRQAVANSRNAQYADYGMGSFRDYSAKDLQQFFERVNDVSDALPGVNYFRARAFVSRWLKFSQHNLLSGRPAAIGCDLVLCRNVLIYFEDGVKRQVQELFHDALLPGGVLVMGGPDQQYWPERYERRFGDGGAWYIRKD